MYVGTKCFKNIKFRIKKKERRAGYVIRRKNEKRR